MRTVNISFEHLASILWQRVLEETAFKTEYSRSEFFKKVDDLEKLRSKADFNTGSISAASAWILYSAACFFKPVRVLEIGTFIGKSTLAIALGADANGSPAEIHTCDDRNAIDLPPMTQTRIIQYKKTASTSMLEKIKNLTDKRLFDFVHIDGRIQDADIPYLLKMLDPNAVIVLDDFEGVEKGVSNAIKLTAERYFAHHAVISPCTREVLKRHGILDRSKSGLMIPTQRFQVTAQ